MRHKSKNKIRPLFTLSLEMTRLVETRLLLVLGVNSDMVYKCNLQTGCDYIENEFPSEYHISPTKITSYTLYKHIHVDIGRH